MIQITIGFRVPIAIGTFSLLILLEKKKKVMNSIKGVVVLEV